MEEIKIITDKKEALASIMDDAHSWKHLSPDLKRDKDLERACIIKACEDLINGETYEGRNEDMGLVEGESWVDEYDNRALVMELVTDTGFGIFELPNGFALKHDDDIMTAAAERMIDGVINTPLLDAIGYFKDNDLEWPLSDELGDHYKTAKIADLILHGDIPASEIKRHDCWGEPEIIEAMIHVEPSQVFEIPLREEDEDKYRQMAIVRMIEMGAGPEKFEKFEKEEVETAKEEIAQKVAEAEKEKIEAEKQELIRQAEAEADAEIEHIKSELATKRASILDYSR